MVSKRIRFDWQRKLVLPVLVLGALVIAGFASSASGPNAQLASQNRVYGGGHFIVPDGTERNFAVDAHASGQAAFGDVEYAGISHWSHEQVLCVTVVGQRATIGTVITKADRRETIGMLTLFVLSDGGPPLSGTQDSSTFHIVGPANDPTWPGGFPNTCPTPEAATALYGLEAFSLDGGDVVVQNAK
jgi:hypothetical protein